MKILIQNFRLTGGGAERVAASMANGLSRKGHSVIMLTDLRWPVTYKVDKAVCLENIYNKVSNTLFRRIKVFLQIRELLKKEKPDVIITINSYFGLEARLATWTSHACPIIQTEHNSFERPKSAPFPLRQKIRKFYENYLYDHITVLTQADIDCLKGRFKNITVMPNPLFLPPLKSVPDKEKIVLAVGRLDAWHVKGFDLLVKAWNELGNKYTDWKLRIVGAGNDSNKSILHSLCKVPNIEFKEYTPKISDEYKQAAVFVLSSRYEGFGLVLIEAMSQGCASIACDYKGRQAELLDNEESGLLCECDSVPALKNQIQRLLDDSVLREKIQRNALTHVTKFEEERIIEKWDSLIKQVTKNN